jgi:hypothetical protein
MDILQKIKKIKHNNEKNWLAIAGVVSVGIGYVEENQLGIIIGVKNKSDSVSAKIPLQIDGIDIKIKIVDDIKAF